MIEASRDFAAWVGASQEAVEAALALWVSEQSVSAPSHHAPADLVQAMRYAVLDGGKRLRPLLVLGTSESVSQASQAGQTDTAAAAVRTAALRAACAVELIHAYSLVHDDMPCMDNDLMRRGKPTVHVQYGQAGALLAGDALQALAFELLTPDGDEVALAMQAKLCAILARAAGCAGMAGGQAIDLASVGLTLTEAQLHEMHRLKTGALLEASVLMGACCGHASTETTAHLREYGAAIGLAFQVVDDILDVTGDASTLGKTPGKDAQHNKPTYVSLMGLDGARRYADHLHQQASAALSRSAMPNTALLRSLADMVVSRVA